MPPKNENKVQEAFDIAAQNCGGRPQMLAALNISDAWMFMCINKNKVSLKLALKLQTLTRNKVGWQELCPEDKEEITAVAKYLTI